MAPVQSKNVVVSGATSVQLSFDALPAVGNTIAVVCAVWAQDEGNNLSCSDNQSNVVTARSGVNGSSAVAGLASWTIPVTNSSGTFTVTVSGMQAAGDMTLHIVEIPGTFHAFSYDAVVPAPALAGTRSITTTEPSCELLGFLASGWTINPVVATLGGGFSTVRENTNNLTANDLFTASRTVTSTGTYAPTWTWGDASNHEWLAGIFAFVTNSAPSGQGALLSEARNRLVLS
jgi:hypothetical protein